MLARLTGILESISGNSALIVPAGLAGLAVEVLLPAFVATKLTNQVGQSVTLHTFLYLEGQGQGTSFEPRLIAFAHPTERAFFELFTTVKGIGNRKALRAMAESPAAIASAIARKDAKALTQLPEIGKRMAETVIAELTGKVDSFLAGDVEMKAGRGAGFAMPSRTVSAPVADAIAALCGLGETRADAEQKVERALERAARTPTSADEIIGLVFGLGGLGSGR